MPNESDSDGETPGKADGVNRSGSNKDTGQNESVGSSKIYGSIARQYVGELISRVDFQRQRASPRFNMSNNAPAELF